MDFRATLKPRPGPKLGSEVKTNIPTKVDFRSVLGKKEGGSSKPPLPEPLASSTPADFRSVLNKKNLESEKAGGKQVTSVPTAGNSKQSSMNGMNGAAENKMTGMAEKGGTQEKVDGGDAEKKSKSAEKLSPAPRTDIGAAESKTRDTDSTMGQETRDTDSTMGQETRDTDSTMGREKTSDADRGRTEKTSNSVDGEDEGKVPSFTQTLKDVTVVDGERLRLECMVTSEPPAVITWFLDGKLVKPSKFIVLSQEGRRGKCSLTIDKALPEDEGRYKCKAENSGGKAECSCMVHVDGLFHRQSGREGPLFVLQFPGDLKIRAGEKVELLCQFGGSTPMTCMWLKFKKPIQRGSGGITIESSENSSQLTIAASEQHHSGCYTLDLQNKYGTRQASLNLTVVDKPDPPAGVPAASDIRQSSLTLSWYGPTYDGGSIVQSYDLEIWNSLEEKWRSLTSCNSTSYHVQQLLTDRQYKFRVRAVNMYGVGEPSAESEPVTVGVPEEAGEGKRERQRTIQRKRERGNKKKREEEAEPAVSDDDSDKDPEYRDVVIKKDCSVKDFYDVADRLGTGKFGQVFKLVEKSTKKVWAGKFIKAFSQKEKENVRQEIGIMNSLHHPKLVQCIDAFEGKSDIVMVMEMISGGELFERIVDEDFELTEREVIKYMLQIIDGVQFIHKQGIVHLDLKPENIMCVNKTGTKIKLIDFGLARRLEGSASLKVLFGTPEFVAPEVINYEEISYPTDMWSIGVICYILVSGLSPFMGDNDNETLANVTSATWDFEDEAFDEISEQAKSFISRLLKKDMKARLTCAQCLEHTWLKQDTKNMEAKQLSKERMKKYILRRRWQKTGNAVRAISRFSSMGMLGGIGPKKSSPTEEKAPAPFLETVEDENHTPAPPSFSLVFQDVEVVEGSAARFDCKIEGYPDPEVVWYKDDQPIKETRHFQIDYEEDGHCSLVISEVCPDDDAKYMCKAVNTLGEACCTAELMVEFMQGEEEEEEEEE
ncbi:hypothetical protein P4O66_006974 [Electrophorus voltai]|uniref:Myosin light chain kinase, smooth muscle n=1 Tax=Electrophorus voltai TaxID=2609070 RepID=A0AAD8ZFR8_9TELE|nr:hypothetical protein P4O66_006974 [Electrophorus voltai]